MIYFLRISGLMLLTITLSACQLFQSPVSPSQPGLRLQGTLTRTDGQWLLQTCATQERYIVRPSATLSEELNRLSTEAASTLFADMHGQIDSSQRYFTPTQRYRLQAEGHDCNDPDFARLLIRASGNEPFWSILQTPQGLIFNQVGEPALALPYIEEQLPDGRFSISTQANNQNLQLWITPQQCTDSMSGAVYHLSAQLQWNQQTLHGCAAYGALRH